MKHFMNYLKIRLPFQSFNGFLKLFFAKDWEGHRGPVASSIQL